MPSNPDAKKPRKKLKTTVGQNTHDSGNQFGHAKKPLVLEIPLAVLAAKVYPYIQSRFYRSPEAYSAHKDTGEFAGKARQRVNNYFLNIFWLEFCGCVFFLGCLYRIHFQDCLLDIAFPDTQDTKLDLWVRVCAERT